MPPGEHISLSEASRRSGVSASTLQRWAAERIVPVRRGRWTTAAAAQARVVARMRERGHSLEELKKAGREGRLAFGFAEDLFPGTDEHELVTVEDVARETNLEPELVERILVILGTPRGRERLLNPQDVEALRHCARVLAAGFPLVAFLQLVRVYVQSLRRVADAEVRLFHLYVHEPMIRDGVPELEMAEEIEGLASDILPLAAPLTEYLHTRYLRFFLEQDVVGHMENELDAVSSELGQVPVTLCFIDLTGFTRYTEEEGDLEALDVVENFVATVEATLPQEATIVKTIGDEVMVVSPEPAALTEWAVDLLARLPQRPRPRVAIHCGEAVYRDGDYFGSQVNLAHRVVSRAQAGEVLVTDRVVGSIEGREKLAFEAIGEVNLKGFPAPTPLFLIRAAES
jgi:adenylate cyclase